MNSLDLHIAHVLNRLPVGSDATKMRVEPIVSRPRRVSVCYDVFVSIQVDALVTLWTEENLGTHALVLSGSVEDREIVARDVSDESPRHYVSVARPARALRRRTEHTGSKACAVSWYPGSRGQAAPIGGRGIARREQSSGWLLPLEEQGVTWETLPPGRCSDAGLTPEEAAL